MKLSVQEEEGRLKIQVVLVLEDKDDGTNATLTGHTFVPEGTPLEIITDKSRSRAAASGIVGRLITSWKMSMIDQIDEAIVAAMQEYLAGRVRRGKRSGE